MSIAKSYIDKIEYKIRFAIEIEQKNITNGTDSELKINRTIFSPQGILNIFLRFIFSSLGNYITHITSAKKNCGFRPYGK